MKRHRRFIVLVFIPIFLVSCSLFKRSTRPAMTLEDIVKLSHDQVASETIIAQIKESKTVFPLKVDQIIELKEQGVASEVMDYMLESFVDSERHKIRWTDTKIILIGLAATCLICHDQNIVDNVEDNG
jgi:hypothetical protein